MNFLKNGYFYALYTIQFLEYYRKISLALEKIELA